MFQSINEYKNIENETKTIYEKSKTLTKDEIAEYTGDEMLNFNTSDKIDKPFTVLVMGIDSTVETLDKNATGNGDALMLVTFNTDIRASVCDADHISRTIHAEDIRIRRRKFKTSI